MKMELHGLCEETDLNVHALVFMKSLETSKKIMSIYTGLSMMGIGGRDITEHECKECIIILSPYIIGIRGERGVRIRKGTIQPRV